VEFADVLRGRRMVRHYRPEPVPALRRRLAAVAEPWYLEHGHQPWISQAPVHVAIGVREASYHERYTESDKLTAAGAEIPWPVPFWWFDAGALFMLLQLAAIDEGLATCFCSPAPPEELDALAKIAEFPDDVALVGVLTLGHPADPAAAPTRRLTGRRTPLDELITWRA
jgi:nitroreductase